MILLIILIILFMQTTLLSFLGQKEVYPTIFYLKNYNVDFINRIPNKSKFIGKIKWKYSSNDLSIFIDINEYETDLYQFNNNYTTNNISLLKSQLQKAIRRKLTDISINIAYQMINLSFNDFLRRLAIITLEDVILNQHYPVLIWMMIAYSTKKWKPNNQDILWLLSYVKCLCNIDLREKYLKIDYNTPICDFNNKFYNILIYCLELRKSYGGMKGDIKFISWFIKEWIERFQNNSDYISSLNTQIILLKDFPKIRFIDFIEGVDFHHYPSLITEIQIQYPQYSQEEIKNAIWHSSSKINYRTFINNHKEIINNDFINIWNSIKQYKEELSKKYLIKNKI